MHVIVNKQYNEIIKNIFGYRKHSANILCFNYFWFLKVPQSATVRDLKKAIRRHFELHQRRTGNKVKISWRYIWKTYNLNFDSLTLDDDESNISDYGVTNKVTLSFKKKRKSK